MKESHHCPFAKAILSGHSRCKYAESFHISERHGIQCNQRDAQIFCEELSNQLHQQSRFALGITHLPKQMTSNMELRIQCGGINGLQKCLQTEERSPDIQTLVTEARKRYGSVEKIPYQQINQSISQWRPRQRGKRGRGV